MMDFLAIIVGSIALLVLEWHAQFLEQGQSFGVRLGTGHKRDIHATDHVHRVNIDLREDDLFRHTHGVVTTAIKGLVIDSAEVANAW